MVLDPKPVGFIDEINELADLTKTWQKYKHTAFFLAIAHLVKLVQTFDNVANDDGGDPHAA